MGTHPIAKKIVNRGLRILGIEREVWLDIDLSPVALAKASLSYAAKTPSYYLNRGICRPDRVQLTFTGKCNLKCRHCDIWKTKCDGELSTGEWKRVISALARWIVPRHIHFTGGEPFMREDFLEIVKFATDRGITTSVSTNGSLINERNAEEIVDSGLSGIAVSINGFSKKHDYLRGVKGSFDKASGVIKHVGGDIPVSIVTILMGFNQDEVAELVKWSWEEGYAGISFQVLMQNFSAPHDPCWYKKSELWPKDIDAMDSVIDELIALKRGGSSILNSQRHLQLMKTYFRNPDGVSKISRCKVGVSNFLVCENGDVRMCYYMEPVGNMRESPPGEIWNSREACLQRAEIKKCYESCSVMNCNYP